MLKSKLDKYNQTHLLSFIDELDENAQNQYLDEIDSIDFDQLSKLYQKSIDVLDQTDVGKGVITPIECTDKNSLSKEQQDFYYDFGINIMKQGKYAALTMAGGQGTRLGYNGPKGSYVLAAPIGKSLFEIQCNRLIERNNRIGCTIPWYIMTSKENDSSTKAFFEENNYFGYEKSSVYFFTQNCLPMLLENGRIVMDGKNKIKQGADGHGGVFKAASDTGALDDMKARGVEWVFVGGIDNILVRLEDPMFLGFVAYNKYKLGGKSLIKRDPYEKAGVFCKKNNKPCVIEYTEISEEMARMTDSEGNYIYGDLHILCNLFHISVFEDMKDTGLEYHVAHKKTNYIDETGNVVLAESPNAYKYEAFMFDAFEKYDSMGIFRVKREEEFAPIKNKEG